LQDKRVELVRQGDDYMEVAGGQQLLGSLEEPASLLEVLTLGAVTVTARVEAHTLVSATVPTHLQMSAEDFGAAMGDIPDDLALFGAGWMGFYEGLPVTTEDVGQLYGVPMPGYQRSRAA